MRKNRNMNPKSPPTPLLTEQRPAMNKRSKLLWSVLFIIMAATVYAVISQSRSFSFRAFTSYIAGTSKGWLLAAFAGMLGFIVFEGAAIAVICRAFGYPIRPRRGFAYSASDIYFSAITPSATGGQPACAYFMIKDGIPGTVTAIALLANLSMYTVSILIIGIASLLSHPSLFLSFGTLSQVLIVFGCILQALLSAFFFLLLVKSSLLHGICRKGLHFLCKIRLIKHEEQRQNKLDRYMEEYAAYADMLKQHKGTLVKVFFLNLIERMSILSVSLFVFLSAGGAASQAPDIWAIQCYSVIGSNAIPIPGAMGVSDYILLDGFGKIIPSYQSALNLELLSRSLSFYVCVIVCGITTAIKYLIQRKQRKLQ